MEKAPGGTSVGVDDPYEYVDRCDFVTDEGRCRWARDHGEHDPSFADERAREEFRCPAADPDGEWGWRDCPHFRCRNHDRECARCGLTERRMAHSDERPLLEEHHLSYRDGTEAEGIDGAAASAGPADAEGEGVAGGEGDAAGEGSAKGERDAAGEGGAAGEKDARPGHEIAVFLCRWCHSKVHRSWARIDDDVNPDPEAIAEREDRRSREHRELSFESAADRYETAGSASHVGSGDDGSSDSSGSG